MSCNGCGTPTGLNKDQIENLVNKLVNDGVLSGGLQDCAGNKITTGSKIVVCDALASLINEKIKSGDIDVVKAVTYKGGNVVVTKGDGTIVEFPIPAISSLSITAENKLVAEKLNGETAELQLPGVGAVTIDDNKLSVTKLDGTTKEITLPGVADAKIIDNELVVTDYAGSVTKYPLVDVIDVEIRENKLVKRFLSGKETEYQLPGLQSVGIFDGKLRVETLAGNQTEFAMPGLRSISGGGTQIVAVDFLGQETTIDLQDLVGVEGLSFADHKLKYTENNTEHEIELPYAHDFSFDETTRTLSWIEGNTPFSAKIPYTAVSIGDTEVVLTDANGQTVAVRKNEYTLKEKEDFDITLKRGANFDDRIGVNLKENGGINYDNKGSLFVKVGFGLKLDDEGSLSVDIDALLAALSDKFDGDGLVWREGRLHVETEDLVDAIGKKVGYLVNKEA